MASGRSVSGRSVRLQRGSIGDRGGEKNDEDPHSQGRADLNLPHVPIVARSLPGVTGISLTSCSANTGHHRAASMLVNVPGNNRRTRSPASRCRRLALYESVVASRRKPSPLNRHVPRSRRWPARRSNACLQSRMGPPALASRDRDDLGAEQAAAADVQETDGSLGLTPAVGRRSWIEDPQAVRGVIERDVRVAEDH